jgi:hypothetical protein
VAELGPGIYGAEAAARHYFGKSAAGLSEWEAASLAAALPNPRAWHPGSGNGRGCGTNCESYCLLQPILCEGVDDVVIYAPGDCERKCQALQDDPDFDVVRHYNGDTLQCRFVHLSSASVSEEGALSHCWHAEISPLVGSPGAAAAVPDEDPD